MTSSIAVAMMYADTVSCSSAPDAPSVRPIDGVATLIIAVSMFAIDCPPSTTVRNSLFAEKAISI